MSRRTPTASAEPNTGSASGARSATSTAIPSWISHSPPRCGTKWWHRAGPNRTTSCLTAAGSVSTSASPPTWNARLSCSGCRTNWPQNSERARPPRPRDEPRMVNQFSRATQFLRSPRFPIFMIVFVDVLGLGITIPVLPLFAKNQLHAEAWQITSLTSLYFAAQFFASPWLGRLSDRFGRRPVLIFSQAGTLLALLISGSAMSIAWLYLARLIDGLTGGNISVAQAYLSDITDEQNRARGLGTVNASFGLGFVFGPAFGSVVAANFGPRVPFFASAAVSLTTIVLSIFLLPE